MFVGARCSWKPLCASGEFARHARGLPSLQDEKARSMTERSGAVREILRFAFTRVTARVVRVVAAIAVLVPITSCGMTGQGERSAITRGIRASLRDVMRRDATAFCDDFTPAVADQLGAGESCKTRVDSKFAMARRGIEYYAPSELPPGLVIQDIRWEGMRGSAVTTWPWPDIRHKVHVILERVDGRWLIATPVSLVNVQQCSKLFKTTICGHSIAADFRS